MTNSSYKYIWRCARCSCHFTNIYKMDGVLKQEKKCSKCKSINQLTLTNKDISIHCKFFDPEINGYDYEQEGDYPYPASN